MILLKIKNKLLIFSVVFSAVFFLGISNTKAMTLIDSNYSDPIFQGYFPTDLAPKLEKLRTYIEANKPANSDYIIVVSGGSTTFADINSTSPNSWNTVTHIYSNLMTVAPTWSYHALNGANYDYALNFQKVTSYNLYSFNNGSTTNFDNLTFLASTSSIKQNFNPALYSGTSSTQKLYDGRIDSSKINYRWQPTSGAVRSSAFVYYASDLIDVDIPVTQAYNYIDDINSYQLNIPSFDHTDLPSCANKIDLTPGMKYVFFSGVTSGDVYIPKQYYDNPGSRISYFDSELETQPYDTVIDSYILTPNGLYAKQHFDLSSYTGADYMLFNKYLYLEGDDNFSFSIYTPCDIHNTTPTITENSDGAYTYCFDYYDSNGTVHNTCYITKDLNSEDLSSATRFLDSMQSQADYFNQLFTSFYTSLPGILKGFIIFAFNILCVAVLIRLGGYKG